MLDRLGEIGARREETNDRVTYSSLLRRARRNRLPEIVRRCVGFRLSTTSQNSISKTSKFLPSLHFLLHRSNHNPQLATTQPNAAYQPSHQVLSIAQTELPGKMYFTNSTTTTPTTGPVLANPNNNESTYYEDNESLVYYLYLFLVFVSFSYLLWAIYGMCSRVRGSRGAAHREDIEKAYQRGRMDGMREKVDKEE